MTETENISQWFKNENASLKDRARKKLSAAGLFPGVNVKRRIDGAEFSLVAIQYAGITPYGGTISLHGQKWRKDGTLGSHEHYIGRPEDVEAQP